MTEEATTSSADLGPSYKKEMARSVRTRRGSCNWSSDSEVLQDFSPPEAVENCVQDIKFVDDDRRSSLEGVKLGGDEPSVKDIVRSRRTLRRSSSVDEVETRSTRAPAPPALATIYSPTHEILHPMRTLLLQNSCPPTFLQPSPERLTLLLETSCSTKLLQPSHKNLPSLLCGDEAKLRAYKLPDPVSLAETKFSNEAGIREVADYTSSESRPSDDGPPGNVVKGLCEEDRNQNLQEAVDVGPIATVMVVAIDADKKLNLSAVDWALANVAQPGDEIILLGVLQRVSNTMGHRMLAGASKSYGMDDLCKETEILRKLEAVEKKVTESGRRRSCEQKNVKLTVRVTLGATPRAAVVREVAQVKATWAIFDRNVMKDKKFFGEHLSYRVVRMRRDGRSAETICSLDQTLSNSCPVYLTSDTSSMSTLSPDSRSRRFWSKITSFRSSRDVGSSTPGSSSESSSPRTILPTAMAEDSESCGSEVPEESFSFGSPKDNIGLDNLSAKLKSFYLGQEADHATDVPSSVAAPEFVYNQGPDVYRRHQAGRPVPAVLVS